MNGVPRAIVVLQEAETVLRKLVSEAAASGDYVSVMQIASWARTVGELAESVSGKREESRLPPVSPKAKQDKSTPAARRTSRPPKADYPKFFRRDDQLVRIAWSKKERKEYQHKASHSVLQSLAKAMAQIGADGRVFSTDHFLPLRDADGTEIPNYQAYVGISLMKQMALLDQHGRQGYSIPRVAEFKETVESIWQKLPKK